MINVCLFIQCPIMRPPSITAIFVSQIECFVVCKHITFVFAKEINRRFIYCNIWRRLCFADGLVYLLVMSFTDAICLFRKNIPVFFISNALRIILCLVV